MYINMHMCTSYGIKNWEKIVKIPIANEKCPFPSFSAFLIEIKATFLIKLRY